jgi:predicted 3-demethylubiquinone-9 3-methyltransferase (glyoxalase superfamily)
MTTIRKITPCLWFDTEAEAAANFYVGIFDNSRISRIARYGKVGQDIHGRQPGSVMTVAFEIDGQSFLALNGGPQFTFSEAVSFIVSCETQAELDRFWDRLTDGGEAGPCGWLKDRFGVSWQVVPSILPQLMTDPDPEKPQRVMQAFLQMKKLDVAVLERAAAGQVV